MFLHIYTSVGSCDEMIMVFSVDEGAGRCCFQDQLANLSAGKESHLLVVLLFDYFGGSSLGGVKAEYKVQLNFTTSYGGWK